MSARLFAVAAAASAALMLGACSDTFAGARIRAAHPQSSPGSNQSGNVSSAARLVARRAGASMRRAHRFAASTLTWTASVAAASLSSTSTTTDVDGKASVTWTLAPTSAPGRDRHDVGDLLACRRPSSPRTVRRSAGTVTRSDVSVSPMFSRSRDGAASLASASALAPQRAVCCRSRTSSSASTPTRWASGRRASTSYRSMSVARGGVDAMRSRMDATARRPTRCATSESRRRLARARRASPTRRGSIETCEAARRSVGGVGRARRSISRFATARRMRVTDFRAPLGPTAARGR